MDARTLGLGTFCLLLTVCGLAGRATAQAAPRVAHPDLALTAFAEAPDLVTPIGVAVDGGGRVFVVESHTHRVEPTYDGPKHDRVKVFEDRDGDGRADQSHVFADGFTHAMNLAFGPDGALFVVHRNGVVRLEDKDGDGRADDRRDVLVVDTKEVYPHNGLGSVAFSGGWMYVGMGENFGQPFTIRGTDGSQHAAAGAGGHVYRCRPDGSSLTLVAEGLWNPFGLTVWRGEYVLAVDNDPDATPPNRLLDVVPGGDFGFRFEYGRSGLHPFQAWNGELPGTLPMVNGVGEAASGIVAVDGARLPRAFRDTLLVTSWGDHRIEVHRPRPRGASLTSEAETLVEGDESFRPVAIAVAPDGAVFFSDWVDRSYAVHKKGRLWRLAPRAAARAIDRLPVAARPPFAHPDRARLHALRTDTTAKAMPRLRAALRQRDPFLHAAAAHALSHPDLRAAARAAADDRDARVRLGGMLALRRGGEPEVTELLERRLGDPDPAVRLLALRWAAEARLEALAPRLGAALTAGPTSPRLLEAYNAAARRLGSAAKAAVGADNDRVVEATAVADDAEDVAAAIDRLLRGGGRTDPFAHHEAVRRLFRASHPKAAQAMKTTALNRKLTPALRAEAIVGMAIHGEAAAALPLLEDPAPAVRLEAARALRLGAGDARVRAAVERRLAAAEKRPEEAGLAEQLRFVLALARGDEPARPADARAWLEAAGRQRGDVEAGRRVFFSPTVGCARCHSVEGHGGRVGPDLSIIGRGMKEDKLLQSILEPSREIAPQWITHTLTLDDGETLTGTLAGESAEGALTLTTLDGRVLLVPARRIATRSSSDTSAMPTGLEQSLTVQDMRDLLSFLATRRQ